MKHLIAISLLALGLAACETTPATQPAATRASAPVASATPAPAVAPAPVVAPAPTANPATPAPPVHAVAARPVQEDEVTPGDDAAETKHNHKGQDDDTGDWTDRTYRHSVSGWFSWDLKVDPAEPNQLWVTYAGVDKRRFNILVDDKLLSDATQPGNDSDFYEQKFPIPLEMTKGKDKVTVKFQARGENQYAGGVFGVRTMRASDK